MKNVTGLNAKATRFIEEHARTRNILLVRTSIDSESCKILSNDCKSKTIYETENNGLTVKIKGDEHRCVRWKDKSTGLQFEEFIQVEEWPQSNLLFLALRWTDTGQAIEETLWQYDETSDGLSERVNYLEGTYNF